MARDLFSRSRTAAASGSIISPVPRSRKTQFAPCALAHQPESDSCRASNSASETNFGIVDGKQARGTKDSSKWCTPIIHLRRHFAKRRVAVRLRHDLAFLAQSADRLEQEERRATALVDRLSPPAEPCAHAPEQGAIAHEPTDEGAFEADQEPFARGDRRENIYFSDEDRLKWLELLGDVCKRFNWLNMWATES